MNWARLIGGLKEGLDTSVHSAPHPRLLQADFSITFFYSYIISIMIERRVSHLMSTVRNLYVCNFEKLSIHWPFHMEPGCSGNRHLIDFN